jgi:hypothetical protein
VDKTALDVFDKELGIGQVIEERYEKGSVLNIFQECF